jgi:glutamine---fructose-6-phosphate transaminase (isomerizing)
MPGDGSAAPGLRALLEGTTAWREASTGGEAIAAALEAARGAPQGLVDRLARCDRIVVTGAGSSYYIAQVAASAMRTMASLPAVAAPLSEVLLRPDDVLAPGDQGRQLVVIVSRSGSTTEAVDVVRASAERGQGTLAVTCRPGSPMTDLAEVTLAVPAADEAAIVMTRSFLALTSLLCRLGARLGDPTFERDLDRLPERWQETGPQVETALRLASTDPSRVVVLGGGAAFGVANEAVLKLTETSQVPASAFHPLEFRHGPISVCEPGVLVVGLLGGSALEAEQRVIDECAALGATTWVLGPDGPGADLSDVARLPLVLHPLQALALGVAIRRGRDPEAPRHLGQVVVLEHD